MICNKCDKGFIFKDILIIKLRQKCKNCNGLGFLPLLVSGNTAPITGWYKYDGHVETGNFDCFIPQQTNRMLFKRGKEIPFLGSCNHQVKWQFTDAYK